MHMFMRMGSIPLSRLLAVLFTLVLLLHWGCGADARDGAQPDLTGTWWMFGVPESGIDYEPIHVTMVQSGTAITMELTCEDDWPVGTGSFVAGALSITFDLGGGEVVTATGVALGDELSGTYTIGGETELWRMERTDVALDCTQACAPITPTRFVDQDFTNLAAVAEISLFRSSEGHDYSDACEECRSMKHYYVPKPAFLGNALIEIRAPVDGTIIEVMDSRHGASPPGENKQVRIRSSLHPEYTFVLFHVDLLDSASVVGTVVSAGEQIGWARMWYPDLDSFSHDYDIAVWYFTPYHMRYVSFFDVMTDALFATYQARGVSSRGDLILDEAARDGDPLTCAGESITNRGALPAWVVLSP